MSLQSQANNLATLGAAFRRQTQTGGDDATIRYQDPETQAYTDLDSAYFGGERTDLAGDAGLHYEEPSVELSVLKSELASPVIGAVIHQGSDKWRVRSIRNSRNGVEHVLELESYV